MLISLTIFSVGCVNYRNIETDIVLTGIAELDEMEAFIQQHKDMQIQREVGESKLIVISRHRNTSYNNSDLYWLTVTQILEIQLMMGDNIAVEKRIRFDRLNESGPETDLKVKSKTNNTIIKRYNMVRERIGKWVGANQSVNSSP